MDVPTHPAATFPLENPVLVTILLSFGTGVQAPLTRAAPLSDGGCIRARPVTGRGRRARA